MARQTVTQNSTTSAPLVKKVCFFCRSTDALLKNPVYTDVVTLRKFVTERGKIVAKQRSGACSKHQRKIALNVKYARHLALLPFSLQA